MAVIVELYHRQRVVIFARQLRQLAGKILRREMSAQLGALQSAGAIYDLGASVVALGPATRRIYPNNVLPRLLHWEPDLQPPVVRGLHYRACLHRRLLNRLQIKHAFSRRQETRHRIFRVLLWRLASHDSPARTPPRNLLILQPMLLDQRFLLVR